LSTRRQLALFPDSVSDLPLSEEGLEARFRRFHAENPHVYGELAKLARQAKRKGRRKIGIKMLFEVVRWNRFLTTTDTEYKLNNNFHSRYARLIMDKEADLRGIFDLRGLRT
jgi:hypothetical protein